MPRALHYAGNYYVDILPHNSLAFIQIYMFTLEEFQGQFGAHGAPSLLVELFKLQEKVGSDLLGGFCLDNFSRDEMNERFNQPAVANLFIEFAEANEDGLSYGLWCVLDNLDECPVVVFHERNPPLVVAANLGEFYQALSYDGDLRVSEVKVAFEKDEDYEPSEHRVEFLQWLGTAAASKPEVDAIVAKAQQAYQQNLAEFTKQ